MATEPMLTFTDNAAHKVAALIQEEGNPNLKLRVAITGGGCSGFQYNFSFDEQQSDDDFVITKTLTESISPPQSAAAVTLLIDCLSMGYLRGAVIDYKQDLNGEQFIIKNPNAKTTCGCGSSFVPQDDEGL